MSLTERIEKDFLAAYKAREEERVAVLRMLKTAIKNAQVELKRPPDENEVLALVGKQLKQRRESEEQFRAAGRVDLADKEAREADILTDYLPEPLAQDELIAIVDKAVNEVGATSPRDMGRVMQLVMEQARGRADGKEVSALVRARLS